MILSYSRIGAADNQPTRHECTFDGLVAWLSALYEGRGPGPKDGPYLSFADYSGTDSEGRTGIRSYGCLVGSHAVPLDLDLGKYTWTAADISARLAGYAYVAWTTYTHSPEVPRWRVVVPVDRPMTADEHRGTWTVLASLFANDCGESSKDATRLNYLPGACLHPEAADLGHGEGALFPVQAPVPDANASGSDDLTDEPAPGYDGPEDDDELIAHMLAARNGPVDAFAPPGTPTKFQALWTGHAGALSERYPPREPHQLFDHTAADLALANELAYYTGGNGERAVRLFERSELAQRDSYEERKAVRAVLRACNGRTQYAFMRKPISAAAPTSQASDPTGGAAAPSVPEGTPADRAIVAALHRCTDMRNAQRLYEAFGSQMLSAAGEFYVWAGTHWEGGARLALRNGCHLSAIVAEELKPLRERARLIQGQETKDLSLIAEWEMLDALIPALEAWGAKCEQSSVINAALAILKSLLDVPMTSFDTDPWALNCRNGTLDLRTGELRAHNPADRITRCLKLAYDPAAPRERYTRFMSEVFPDPATVDYLQRYFGYSITGVNREQTMLVHWGKGSNGKNTLHKAIRNVLDQYAQVGPPGLLTSDKDGSFIHELASLYGARWVSVDESDDGAKLKEAAMKQMTGDDNVKGRHLYKSFFEYRPTYKLHLMTNHKPRVANTDFGVWRRLLLLPYTQKFTEENGNIDKTLDAALEAEAPGILAWLVEGTRRYMVEGLKLCPEIRIASAEYRNEEDMLGQFVTDKCVVEAGAEVPVAVLYAAYAAWAREAGAFVLSKKRLHTELTERPLSISTRKVGKNNETRYFGIKLL